MRERNLKQVFLELETETGKKVLEECKRKLKEEGLCVEILQADFPLPEEKTGILFLTDSAKTANRLSAASFAVLGYLNKENSKDNFETLQFLFEDTEALSTEYLEMIYCRKWGLPVEILTTQRLVLRETTEQDIDAFYRIYAEPSITRYMENLFEDREKERDYITAYRKYMYGFYGFGFWTVLLKETGEIIGRAGLTMREGSEIPELGFVIGVPWQGRGLAREICEAILMYGAEELGFTQVQAYAEPENLPSVRLLKQLGFKEAEEKDEGKKEEKKEKYLKKYLTNISSRV